MPTIQEVFQLAMQHHAAGRLDDAESLYRVILQHDPRHADSLHLMGVTAYQRGRPDETVTWIRQALNHQDREPNYHQNLALALRVLGRWQEAADSYGRIVTLDPRRADAYVGLGIAHAGMGNQDEALACWRAALGIDPAHGGALFQITNHLRNAGALDEAVSHLRNALKHAPDNIDHTLNLGLLLRQMNRPDEAAALYRRLLALYPDHAGALYGLADGHLRRGEPTEARVAFVRTLSLDPFKIEAYDGLARCHEGILNYDQAADCFRRHLILEPQDHRSWYNLGTVRENQIDFPAAIACYDRALRLDRRFGLAWSKIGHKLNYCDWRTYAEDEADILRFIRDGDGHIPAIPLVYMASTPTDQLLSARRQIQEIEQPKVADLLGRVNFPHRAGPREKLTVGYVSGDFREHAVAFLIAEFLELHDRSRFTVIGYSNGPDRHDQPMRQRLVAAVDRMVDIREMSSLEVAQRIHADGVDILVDLSGHTRHSRLEVFALRPAPVQVTYLGYPGTTGADFFDYILVDPVVVPANQQPYYSEKLAHLPDCYQANDRKRPVAPGTPSRADCKLPEEGFVFCSFNHAPKITPTIFAVWMRILKAVPKSVLWLLQPEPPAQENLTRAAAAHGVDPARVIFAPRLALPYHLARFRTADLFLDTFPYNAHTTASDSLWVGCPILTCMGDTFPSRVAASLLTNTGVPELITRSLAEYEQRAIELAETPDTLREYRRRLEAGRDTCPAFDTPRFARNVEQAYERMWMTFNAGS